MDFIADLVEEEDGSIVGTNEDREKDDDDSDVEVEVNKKADHFKTETKKIKITSHRVEENTDKNKNHCCCDYTG